MKNLFSRFVKDESGATAIEYGLIAALVSVVIITALGLCKATVHFVRKATSMFTRCRLGLIDFLAVVPGKGDGFSP
jgi:Flp pilus assembly pilin Flp